MRHPVLTVEADPAFLTEVLRAAAVLGPEASVAEVEHEAIGVGVGIVGQLARLGLRYRGASIGAPGSLVLKLPSQYPENRAVGDHFRFYEREGLFYRHVAEKLPVRVPHCFWNHLDVAGNAFGLLLEDLGGRTAISQLAGADPERARQALAAVGRLHGAWWASPGLDAIDWMPRLDDPVNLAAGEQYRQAWPAFVERVGARLPAGALRLGERVQNVFEDLLRAGTAEAPLTICHGDFRLDNLLFAEDAIGNDGVAVLDWQISFRGPAVSDVAYFLCQSLDVDVRRRHEADLVRHWHQTVMGEVGIGGLESYPLAAAWDHYRRSVLATTVYPVTAAGAMDPANDRGRQLVELMAERSFAAAMDLGSEDLLPA